MAAQLRYKSDELHRRDLRDKPGERKGFKSILLIFLIVIWHLIHISLSYLNQKYTIHSKNHIDIIIPIHTSHARLFLNLKAQLQ